MTMRWLSMSSTRRPMTSESAEPGGVGGHEDGAVLEARDQAAKNCGDLVGAEDDGELLGLLGEGMRLQDAISCRG